MGFGDQIIGIGTDILQICRISDAIGSAAFMDRTFTEKERALAGKRSRCGHYYAKLFACKEAVFKSLGINGDNLKLWKEIEVLDGNVQQPVVYLHGLVADEAAKKKVAHVFVSCSYETEYALAFAIATGGDHYGYIGKAENENS